MGWGLLAGGGLSGRMPFGDGSGETDLVLGKGARPEGPPRPEGTPLLAWPGGL